MWRSIFDAKAGSEDASFTLREAVADGRDVVGLTLPSSMTDDDARSRVQQLVRFVHEVEAEHADDGPSSDTLSRLSKPWRHRRFLLPPVSFDYCKRWLATCSRGLQVFDDDLVAALDTFGTPGPPLNGASRQQLDSVNEGLHEHLGPSLNGCGSSDS